MFVMLSTFGSTHTSVFAQSRLVFVGARRGQFPYAFGLVSTKNYTPVPALIFSVSDEGKKNRIDKDRLIMKIYDK